MSLPDISPFGTLNDNNIPPTDRNDVNNGSNEKHNEEAFNLVENILHEQLELHKTKTAGYGQCIGMAIRSIEDGTESSPDTRAQLEDLLQSHQMGITYANDLLNKGSKPCRLPYGKARDIYRIPEIGWPASFGELIQAYQIMLDDLDQLQQITLTDDEVVTIFHYYLLIQERNNWETWHNRVVKPLFRKFIEDNLPPGAELPNRDIDYTLANKPGSNGFVESKLNIDQKRELLLKYIPLFLDARGHAVSENKLKFRGYDQAELLSTLDGVRRIWAGIMTYIQSESINISPDVQAQIDSLLSNVDRIIRKFKPGEEISVEYSII